MPVVANPALTSDPESIFESASVPLYIELEPFGVLTTTDEIRAVFGLSSAELTNDMLMQPIYIGEVRELLFRIRKDLFSDWSTLKSDRLLELVKRAAIYCICNAICRSLPLIAAKVLTDSKASFQRYTVDLNVIAESIQRMLHQAIHALKQTRRAVARPIFMGEGKPEYDPVTG